MNELTREELEFLGSCGGELLRKAGIRGDVTFRRLSGGRNNRVYLVTGVEPAVVLKWYFHHPQDQRDRLHAEFSFLQFAEMCGAECVPRPLARADADRLALYTYVDGRALAPDEIDQHCVRQAVEFFQLLNDHRDTVDATRLPCAAEACFSLQDHVACVAKRVARLESLPGNSPLHADAAKLVEQRMRPGLRQAEESLARWVRHAGASMTNTLSQAQRCISPSDFGFHNALRRPDGRLAFFDFEYAGWDDPAKTICDFYCQPQSPVPRATWRQLEVATAKLVGDSPLERQRQATLLPLYQVKWCCILLNEFLPDAAARRGFADARPADLATQLAKAQRLAEELK